MSKQLDKKKCDVCGKSEKYMYADESGIYCKKHVFSPEHRQRQRDNMKQDKYNWEEIEKAYPEAYEWARKFHNLYEENAPLFGYETRKETKEFDPKSNNGRLMAYVCYNIAQDIISNERNRIIDEIEGELRANAYMTLEEFREHIKSKLEGK